MTRGTRVDGLLLIAAVMALTAVSNAATVVTQVQSRAHTSTWLLNLNGQQRASRISLSQPNERPDH